MLQKKRLKINYIDRIQDNIYIWILKIANLIENTQTNNSENMSIDGLHCNEVNTEEMCLESNLTKINGNISSYTDLNIFNCVTWIIIAMLCVFFIIPKLKQVFTRKLN